jgi:hypothetical protein
MQLFPQPAFTRTQRRNLAALFVLIYCAVMATGQDAGPTDSKHKKSKHKVDATTVVLWEDPGDIRSRDLYYGIGGKEHEPKTPVKFEKEDLKGTSPKFDVQGADAKKWRVKTGFEARPETAATRLLWAVGYFANENYYFPELKVEGLVTLQRGREFVKGDEVMRVRLQRDPPGLKKTGDWDWKDKKVARSREFNGLRVMMALLNNWDLKDENNAILEDEKHPGREVLEVSDLGASFGRAGKSYTDSITKSNPAAYKRTKFIKKVHTGYVDFNFPTHPPFLYIFNPPFFIRHFHNRWIGKHVPRADAKWIGSLLGQLSPEQIRSAFRAAGYKPDEVETYATALESRIAELKRL